MTTLYSKIDKADWSFMDTWVEEVALEAAEQVYRGGGWEFSDELEDMKQHALLYCATHPKEVGKIRTRGVLRKHLASRVIQDHRKGWETSREQDNYGDEVDLYLGDNP